MCSKRGTKDNTNLAMNSNNTNVQDAKEQYEIERKMNNAHSLVKNITKFFEDRFSTQDVTIYAVHRDGKKRLEGTFCRAIVCTILDGCKRAIILDSSRV